MALATGLDDDVEIMEDGGVVNVFTSFTLKEKQQISPTNAIFTFEASSFPTHSFDTYERLWQSAIWSIQFKQPQLQIGRCYTPLPPSPVSTRQSPESKLLRFLIRKEEGGEVSSYIHSLPLGAEVELRGPNVETMFGSSTPPEDVVILAGGTGVATALQAIHAIFNGDGDPRRCRVTLLWACKRREDCRGAVLEGASRSTPGLSPIVRELEGLKEAYRGHLEVKYFCDEDRVFINSNTVKEVLQRPDMEREERPSSLLLPDSEPNEVGVTTFGFPNLSHGDIPLSILHTPVIFDRKKLILVSGPEGFISHFAGAKNYLEGKEVQGGLGGVLKGTELRDWMVWKY